MIRESFTSFVARGEAYSEGDPKLQSRQRATSRAAEFDSCPDYTIVLP